MALTVNMIQIGRIGQGSKRTPRAFLNMKCANVNNALGDASVECVLKMAGLQLWSNFHPTLTAMFFLLKGEGGGRG